MSFCVCVVDLNTGLIELADSGEWLVWLLFDWLDDFG